MGLGGLLLLNISYKEAKLPQRKEMLLHISVIRFCEILMGSQKFPAGYQVCRIVKENPAKYHNIRFIITLVNHPFTVLPKILALMHNC